MDGPPDNGVARKRDHRLVDETGCRKRVAAVQVVTRGTTMTSSECARTRVFNSSCGATRLPKPISKGRARRETRVALRMHVEQDRSRRLTGREHACDGGSDDGSRVADSACAPVQVRPPASSPTTTTSISTSGWRRDHEICGQPASAASRSSWSNNAGEISFYPEMIRLSRKARVPACR